MEMVKSLLYANKQYERVNRRNYTAHEVPREGRKRSSSTEDLEWALSVIWKKKTLKPIACPEQNTFARTQDRQSTLRRPPQSVRPRSQSHSHENRL